MKVVSELQVWANVNFRECVIRGANAYEYREKKTVKAPLDGRIDKFPSFCLVASAAETGSSHLLGSAALLSEPVGGGCIISGCSFPREQAHTHTC